MGIAKGKGPHTSKRLVLTKERTNERRWMGGGRDGWKSAGGRSLSLCICTPRVGRHVGPGGAHRHWIPGQPRSGTVATHLLSSVVAKYTSPRPQAFTRAGAQYQCNPDVTYKSQPIECACGYIYISMYLCMWYVDDSRAPFEAEAEAEENVAERIDRYGPC